MKMLIFEDQCYQRHHLNDGCGQVLVLIKKMTQGIWILLWGIDKVHDLASLHEKMKMIIYEATLMVTFYEYSQSGKLMCKNGE